MTFSARFAYLEGERVNNVVWALERFQGLFLRRDGLPIVIVTDRDLALMNAVKTVFPECTNLLCRFHIDKNYVMDAWGSLVDCPSEQQLNECLQKFEMAYSPWPMFVDYDNETWIIPHKEKFVTTWTNKMDEDQWTYDNTMPQEVDMDYENEEECGVNQPHVDCWDAFNSSQWARIVAHENRFVAVIMRSDTHTGIRGRSSFVLIGCERSGQYKCRNKEFVRRDTGSRKCGCPFKLHGKPKHGGEGWMVKLICGIHNHELAKSLVGHPYAGRLTKDEKKIIADMTNSMDEVVVRDLFWCHPDEVKLCNACHLVFFIHSTYKTNRYRLPLLDFVGVTPTGMTFFAGFAYLEGERVNNIVWALERFRGLFLRNDRLPVVIVIDRDLSLMNAVKTVFPKCTNLLCRFHIDKNVKAKCKSLIGQKNAWEYFTECLQKFQIACSPWPMFADYVKETWIIPHKEKFITAWTNKVMNLGNTATNRVEYAHWALKRVLQNSLGDLCSV
ncbi:Protein FAR1-RELATED SEQUENCE 6 [Glycine max]|nr:Protein FAR1-RELATED SEQUENCE 6 [Glycine max]